jgi:hypothetical protein
MIVAATSLALLIAAFAVNGDASGQIGDAEIGVRSCRDLERQRLTDLAAAPSRLATMKEQSKSLSGHQFLNEARRQDLSSRRVRRTLI